MKSFLLSIGCLLATHLASAQLAPADEQAIRAIITHWNANLNNHRFQDMSTYTTKDLTWITPVGDSWRGQQQVVQAHQRISDQMYKGVPFKSTSVRVQGLTPDVAVAEEEMATGVSYPPDGVNRGTNKEGPGRALCLIVLVKNEGHWRVASGSVTPINEKAVKVSKGMALLKK